MKRHLTLFSVFVVTATTFAQDRVRKEPAEKLDLLRNIEYRTETQVSLAHGKTPLWLNANKYGLSSLDKANGYTRGAIIRQLNTDSVRHWGLGYGIDIASPLHYTSKFIIQQAFIEARWLHGVLSVGSKEYPMELNNNFLSSGSQTFGINARPIPQLRLSLPEYWEIPFTHGWLSLKGHIAYGMITDDNWQHNFTKRHHRYADNVLYHSKAGYLMIENPAKSTPVSFELGLEMACTFGGEAHLTDGMSDRIVKGGVKIKDFWHAFLPGGQDETDGIYGNIAGNQLGSWVMRANYNSDMWTGHIYIDHYFEDHSQMFLLDYNGYGTNEEWNEKKNRRYFLYALQDMMFGTEINLKQGVWVRNIVFEYLYTKYQSGPYNHDHTQNIPDHIAGMDNYYNHNIYTGWQHWGQVIGNPLYRSPIYNEDGDIRVKDNRFWAFHIGVDGSLTKQIDYRALATYQEGWGSYHDPYTKKHHNASFLFEGSYRFRQNWRVKGAYAMDFGGILGRNAGFQVTVSKSGLLIIK